MQKTSRGVGREVEAWRENEQVSGERIERSLLSGGC